MKEGGKEKKRKRERKERFLLSCDVSSKDGRC